MSSRTAAEMSRTAQSIFRMLNQDQAWTDIEGDRHPLEEMTPKHRANTLHFLLRRADRLAFYYGLALADLPVPTAENAARIVDDAMATEWAHQIEDPVGWLHQTALVQRLSELVKYDDRMARMGNHTKGRRGEVRK